MHYTSHRSYIYLCLSSICLYKCESVIEQLQRAKETTEEFRVHRGLEEQRGKGQKGRGRDRDRGRGTSFL